MFQNQIFMVFCRDTFSCFCDKTVFLGDIFLLRVQQQNQIFMVFLTKYLSILKKCFW